MVPTNLLLPPAVCAAGGDFVGAHAPTSAAAAAAGAASAAAATGGGGAPAGRLRRPPSTDSDGYVINGYDSAEDADDGDDGAGRATGLGGGRRGGGGGGGGDDQQPVLPGPSEFHPDFVVMLTSNYRSHPALVSLPSRLFYGGALAAAADPAAVSAFCDWEGLAPGARARAGAAAGGGLPLLFHGVEGEDQREGQSPSWFNAVEAMVRATTELPTHWLRAAAAAGTTRT